MSQGILVEKTTFQSLCIGYLSRADRCNARSVWVWAWAWDTCRRHVFNVLI